MNGVGLASVISSAAVAIATLVTNALTKRGDRTHASTLEYGKRVWDAKTAATLQLIGVCSTLLSLCRFPTETTGTERMLALWAALREVALNSEGDAAVLAYASEDVRIWWRELHKFIDSTLPEHQAGQLRYLRELKRAAIEKGDFQQVERFDQNEQGVLEELNRAGVFLNMDRVKDLCEKLIDAARDDLRSSASLSLVRSSRRRGFHAPRR